MTNMTQSGELLINHINSIWPEHRKLSPNYGQYASLSDSESDLDEAGFDLSGDSTNTTNSLKQISSSKYCHGCCDSLLINGQNLNQNLYCLSSPNQSKEESSTFPSIREVFHNSCLICHFCQSTFINNKDKICWINSNRVSCRACRDKLRECYRCKQIISVDSWIRRLGSLSFHLSCLTCALCDRQLSSGDKCVFKEKDLICASHLDKSTDSDQFGSDSDESSQNGRTVFKRNRTCFSSNQIQVLHKCFIENPNPDGNALEKIAQKAKLSKRVTQVWFQNCRARRKKNDGEPLQSFIASGDSANNFLNSIQADYMIQKLPMDTLEKASPFYNNGNPLEYLTLMSYKSTNSLFQEHSTRNIQ